MKLIYLSLFLILSACSIFAPPYVEEADARATEAYEVLSKILAKADLGLLRSPSTFNDYADDYATVISKFETAAFSVGGAPSGENSTPLAQAKTSLNVILQSCLNLVKLFSKEHKEFGIVEGSGTVQPVRVSCDQAVKAIRATK